MANLHEVARTIKGFCTTGELLNPIKEFASVLTQVVQGDVAQITEVQEESLKLHMRLLACSLIYVQRAIEIAYIFTEVFIRNEYEKWKPKFDSPRIIDLGGDPYAFSAIYWKYRAPDSRVTVVEANPVTAKVMRQNLERRGLEDIQVINAAVAGNSNGFATLHIHKPQKGWHTQDFITQEKSNSSDCYTVEVPKVNLSSLINQGEQIDLLKVDIEGAESDVIRELTQSGKLKQVDQIIMEFHHGPVDFPNNSLAEMIEILHSNGFEINDAHITSGKGLRSKKQVTLADLKNIAHSNQKVYLTITASRKN